MLYISCATRPMSEDDLLRLLEECRKNNARKGITGMLIFCHDTFVQVLEGEQLAVEKLYDTIKHDKRHTGVTLLEKKKIEERKFPEWSMGFKKLSDADLVDTEGLNDFFDKKVHSDYFIHEKNIVTLLMLHFRNRYKEQMSHVELPTENVTSLMEILHKTIIAAVKVLAVLMVVVIILGVINVVYMIFDKLASPHHMLQIGDILYTFGAFMAVLIAIEIFINITLYLRTDVIPVKLVVATALMAISRKVIIFDYKVLSPQYVYASGLVLLALGITYWLVEKKSSDGKS